MRVAGVLCVRLCAGDCFVFLRMMIAVMHEVHVCPLFRLQTQNISFSLDDQNLIS